jgi:hypothetical protein
VKEELFPRSKDEFGTAINALQNLICEFHGRLPRSRELSKSAMTSESAGPSPRTYVDLKGPGRVRSGRRNSSSLTPKEDSSAPVTRRR